MKRLMIALVFVGMLALTGCTEASTPDAVRMRDIVRGDIAEVMSDIDAADQQDPAIGLSSNPFEYADVSPALDRLVRRGEPALEPVVREIEDSADDGLREYVLAIAGQRILGTDRIKGAWSTGKEWAGYYRANR